MKKTAIVLTGFVILVATAVWIPPVVAYPTYSQGKVTNPDGDEESFGNCKTCHGGFREETYVSLTDGEVWSEVYQEVTASAPAEELGLHDIHRHIMLDKLSGSRCDTCHQDRATVGRYPVILNSSVSIFLEPISCMGCHGRHEDDAAQSFPSPGGMGAGLRQHHTNAGINECMTCHADANPANYTPVPESVPPPYYFTPDPEFPNKPTDACSPAGQEDYAGGWEGLDNDGDGVYDIFDSDCGLPMGKVDVCHSQGRGGSATISVNSASVAAHLSHGDSLGPCDQ